MGIFKQYQISRGRCRGCGHWRDQCVCFEMEEHYRKEREESYICYHCRGTGAAPGGGVTAFLEGKGGTCHHCGGTGEVKRGDE